MLQDAASELQKIIDSYIKFANSSDEAYAHIEAEVRVSFLSFFCTAHIALLLGNPFDRRAVGMGNNALAVPSSTLSFFFGFSIFYVSVVCIPAVG